MCKPSTYFYQLAVYYVYWIFTLAIYVFFRMTWSCIWKPLILLAWKQVHIFQGIFPQSIQLLYSMKALCIWPWFIQKTQSQNANFCWWFLTGSQHVHHRREAFKLIRICTASMINIRSPIESGLSGRSIDKLTAMLFSNEVLLVFYKSSLSQTLPMVYEISRNETYWLQG